MDSPINDFFNKAQVKKIRNIGIIAHVDHGKSTLTDNLLAEVGIINKDLAGTQLATDSYQTEKLKGITINSSTVSFLYKDHLFNLTDTPGHVDFSGEVVKTLRGTDGGILLVDIVEGVMTQTETVVGQALNEGLNLVLFINKVDRVVSELFLNSKEIYEKLSKTVSSINALIKRLTGKSEDYFKFEDNVIFGSALNKWGTSVPDIRIKNSNFSEILEGILNKKSLSEKFNLAKILLDKCIEKVGSPDINQKNKLHRTYIINDKEDQYHNLSQDILDCNSDGEFNAVVVDVNYDPYSGLMPTLKILSGKYRKGTPIYSNNSDIPLKTPTRVLVSNLKKFEEVDVAYAGTIVTYQGVDALTTGDTVTTKPSTFVYPGLIFSRRSVVGYSVTPQNISELKKMIDSIKCLVLEDPTLQFTYSQDTKEFTLYGIGMLHLQIALNKLDLIYNVKVNHSPPMIDYSETLKSERSSEVCVRSPNKLNDFKFYIFKLPENLTEKLLKNEITNKNLRSACQMYGISKDLSKKCEKILANGCVYFDDTKGCSFMDVTKENLVKSIDLTLSTGFNLKRAIKGVGFVITDSAIHEDGLHRGINQLRGAFRDGLEKIFKQNPPIVVEPIMKISIDCPYKYLESVSNDICTRRGTVETIDPSDIESYCKIIAICPLAECLTLSSVVMALTEGRGLLDMSLKGYNEVPPEILSKLKLK